MNYIYVFLILNDTVWGISRAITQPSNVWPGSPSGIDLTGMHSRNGPRPVEVWSTSNALTQERVLKTDKSPWVQCNTTSCACDGYLRYGNSTSQLFSPAIVTNKANIQCDLKSIRTFLWSDVSTADVSSTCQCRHSASLNIVLRGKCLSQGVTGWIGPGLVNCTDPSSMNLVSDWKYHPTSGQIRTIATNSTTAFGATTGGLCVTAVPYNDHSAANFSSNWNAWGVQLLPCDAKVNPFARQAWDLPDPTLGDASVNMKSVFPAVGQGPPTVGSQPTGYPGRIKLRDSSDIGNRCLEISLNPPSVPTQVPVVWLEAIICEDIRFREIDFANFQFFLAKTKFIRPRIDHPRVGEWISCMSPTCSECFDEEIRSIRTYSKKISQPVSLSHPLEEKCSIDTIRAIAIPEVKGTCFCQTALSKTETKTLLDKITDDLPSTVRPVFPKKMK